MSGQKTCTCDDTEPERPALSDEQWQRIARLLGTAHPKWRANINHILAFREFLSLRQQRNAARKRDLVRMQIASKLAQKLALLLGEIEAEKLDEVSDAAGLCVNRLNARTGALHRGSPRGKERFLERDFCINLLVSYVWNKTRSRPIAQPVKIGDEKGPLVNFLIEAYKPIESLTPGTVREIARLPSRSPHRYSQDRWIVGDLDLSSHRQMFEEQSLELDEACEQHARRMEELLERQARESERQAREIEEMSARMDREIEELRRITRSDPPEPVAREFEERRALCARKAEKLRRDARSHGIWPVAPRSASPKRTLRGTAVTLK